MQENGNGTRSKLAVIAVLLALGVTLAAQQVSSLIVSGQQGQAKVVQVEGTNYVEVNGLARITGGSISFSGNQIVLSLPGTGGSSSEAPADPAAADQLSTGFLNAGIEAMTQVREWHAALKNAVERSYPLDASWLRSFQAQAQGSLRLAEVAVSTDEDRKAFPLLENEFNNMKKLSEKYLQTAANVSYIAPDSLGKDPLEQKILSCAHSLGSMVSTRRVADDGACQ